MTWSELAWKNGGRRPLRTSVTVAGVAIAIAALFSFLAFQRGYQRGMQGEMDRLGAHILVVPKGCPYDAASIALHGARWPCYLKQAYLAEVRSTFNVDTAAPAFMNAVYDQAGKQSVYMGVDESIRRLRPAWKVEGDFPTAPGELLVGAEMARRMGWKVGEKVPLPGIPSKQGTVRGVLGATGGAEDGFIYTRLADAQQMFKHSGELTHILVRLTDTAQMQPTVDGLRGCDAGMDMNVVPLAHLINTIQTMVGSTRVLLGAVVLVALFIAGTGVSNTVLMSVVERTREIGIMRALGASRFQVFRLFWLETLQICLAGGIVGVIAAFLVSRGLEAWLRTQLPFSPTDTLIRWEWAVVAACVGSGLLLGSAVGILPAWRAARMAPMEAMRTAG